MARSVPPGGPQQEVGVLQLAPPAGGFGIEDLPLMMLQKLQLGPEQHGTLKIHNSVQLTGCC